MSTVLLDNEAQRAHFVLIQNIYWMPSVGASWKGLIMKALARLLMVASVLAVCLGVTTPVLANDCGECWKRNGRPFHEDTWFCAQPGAPTWCSAAEDGSWCIDGSGGCVPW